MSYDSQQMANAAHVMAMAAELNAKVQGMVAENKQREVEGKSMAYVAEDFDNAVLAVGCHWNSIVTMLRTSL